MEPAVGRKDVTVELATVPELSENIMHKWTTPGDEKNLQVFCSIIPAILDNSEGQLRSCPSELSKNCGNYAAKNL